MEAFFNLSLPTGWQSLSDRQLLYFFTQLSRDLPIEEILTLCLFRWADITVLCRLANGTYLVRHHQHSKQEAQLTLRQIHSATSALDFLRHFPTSPVRIATIEHAHALQADFQGIPFSTFISCDNYYQGFLHTKKQDLLAALTKLLYPSIKSKHLTPPFLYNSFYWFASLKQYLARLFPHFLQSMPSEPDNLLGSSPSIGETLRTAMNAQIRALTGGDITKESAVLDMDTWRALTELDAKAKEVEELRRNK